MTALRFCGRGGEKRAGSQCKGGESRGAGDAKHAIHGDTSSIPQRSPRGWPVKDHGQLMRVAS